MKEKKLSKIKVGVKPGISVGTRAALILVIMFSFYVMAYSLGVFSIGAADIFTRDIKSDLVISDPCDPDNLHPACPLNK